MAKSFDQLLKPLTDHVSSLAAQMKAYEVQLRSADSDLVARKAAVEKEFGEFQLKFTQDKAALSAEVEPLRDEVLALRQERDSLVRTIGDSRTKQDADIRTRKGEAQQELNRIKQQVGEAHTQLGVLEKKKADFIRSVGV